jgi:hypothetical protein
MFRLERIIRVEDGVQDREGADGGVLQELERGRAIGVDGDNLVVHHGRRSAATPPPVASNVSWLS